MISYGGLYLPDPSLALRAWAEANLTLSELFPFWRQSWPGPRCPLWPWPGVMPARPVRLGSLWWPVGASHFAVGHFVAGLAQVKALRSLAYVASVAGGYQSLPLVLSDGANAADTITTKLWMLPPRPLAQIPNLPPGFEQSHLLTLVDNRFWWWEAAASVVVTSGTTTWANMFSSIGTALGETITTDAINANYLNPDASLTARYEYLPPLLDACCWNVGHRLVRSLAGVVTTQAALTAKAKQDAQLTKWPKVAGGQFAFSATGQ